jgi:hypothetical protein
MNQGGGLTTEQLASAGKPGATAGETRTFGEGGDATGAAKDAERLFAEDETGELHSSWDAIQAGFVDEPRRAVEDADHLVAATMKRLAEIFADERQRLEGQWDRGDDVSTEDLRVALQRYRAFFTRLLAV